MTLKDINGKLLRGLKVTFTLNGKSIGSATTNSKGVATISLTAKALKTAKAGKKNLVVKFGGNGNYNSVSSTVKITLKKEKTKIAAKKKTFKKSKKTKKYMMALKNSKGKAIKKMRVTLKIKGKTFSAKTNSKGKATFKIKKLTKKGTFKAVIRFKGNKYYNKVTKTVKIKIK
nr:Ig-like domain-containing protein [uncultured Methanobrevibacter sp.]